LSPGFNLVKNPTLGHLLILLSNNFFLVSVLEAIVVPGVQSGQEPLLLKKKSLSFYPWWLSTNVKLLPWMVKHCCVASAFMVVKHSKIVFCFCLEWLSTMFSFYSWWLSFGLLLPFRWLSVFTSVKWLSIVLWLLLNGSAYSNCLWMFFSHFQSATNVFLACFIVYFSTCIVHPKLEVLTPPSISWRGVCCLLIILKSSPAASVAFVSGNSLFPSSSPVTSFELGTSDSSSTVYSVSSNVVQVLLNLDLIGSPPSLYLVPHLVHHCHPLCLLLLPVLPQCF